MVIPSHMKVAVVRKVKLLINPFIIYKLLSLLPEISQPRNEALVFNERLLHSRQLVVPFRSFVLLEASSSWAEDAEVDMT